MKTATEQLAIDMAEKEQHSWLSEMMRSANDQITLTTNGVEQPVTPFNNIEIAYQTMLDTFELTERERDIAVMTTFFESAYKTLHNEFKCRLHGSYGPFGKPTEYWFSLLETVYKLCVKYDMVCILFESYGNEPITNEQYNWLVEIYKKGE